MPHYYGFFGGICYLCSNVLDTLKSKLEEAYLHALHFAIMASESKFMAKTIMSDFELNIIRACK